ncbi:NUDIX hydrolase [Lentzea sp. NPDC004782]|uniref:NUDIX hydrolase n=1 Tax=Lentzea sp. NPDC004782 TaxID=3154458 RepID=UPI0033A5382D
MPTNDHWELPGGVLELDESFEDGLRREVLEETGVSIGVDRLSGVHKNLTRGIVALVFRCHLVGGAPHATDEAKDVRWMTRSEVSASMDPAFAVRILGAFGPESQVRAHDGVNLINV